MTNYSTHSDGNGESLNKMSIVMRCLELLQPLGEKEANAVLNSLKNICRPVKSSDSTSRESGSQAV